MDGLDIAIDKAGGLGKLASALELKPNVVSNWRLRGRIPAERCAAIERVTGVPVELLRPDVFAAKKEVSN